jgi:hypothetical protein
MLALDSTEHLFFTSDLTGNHIPVDGLSALHILADKDVLPSLRSLKCFFFNVVTVFAKLQIVTPR